MQGTGGFVSLRPTTISAEHQFSRHYLESGHFTAGHVPPIIPDLLIYTRRHLPLSSAALVSKRIRYITSIFSTSTSIFSTSTLSRRSEAVWERHLANQPRLPPPHRCTGLSEHPCKERESCDHYPYATICILSGKLTHKAFINQRILSGPVLLLIERLARLLIILPLYLPIVRYHNDLAHRAQSLPIFTPAECWTTTALATFRF